MAGLVCVACFDPIEEGDPFVIIDIGEQSPDSGQVTFERNGTAYHPDCCDSVDLESVVSKNLSLVETGEE